MKNNFIKYCPWIIWIIESLIVLLGGYKLIALQINSINQLEQAWNTTKEVYQLTITPASDQTYSELNSKIHQTLAKQLGTKKTICTAPPSTFSTPLNSVSVEGLDEVKNMTLLRNNVPIPCEKQWIEVIPGEIGQFKNIQEDVESFEWWFWFLGIALVFVKLAELLLKNKIAEHAPKKNSRKKKR